MSCPESLPNVAPGGNESLFKIAAPLSTYKFKFWEPDFLKEYHGVRVPYPFYQCLSAVETFEADSKDVIIVTFPKCGTTFMSAIVHMIQNDANPECLSTGLPLEQKIPYMEMCFPDAQVGTRIIDRICSWSPPRTFFTHLGYHGLPKGILDRAKVIYVARNPKDTIVSMHNFMRATPSWGFSGTLEDTAETFFNNTAIYSPYYDHVADFWKNREKHPNIFFTSFERLLKDFKSIVRDLGQFLGKELTDDQLEIISYHCNFDAMKKNDNVNRTTIFKMGYWDFNISPFMRAGKAGNWKEHFSPELNNRVNGWITKEEERLQDSLKGLQFEYE